MTDTDTVYIYERDNGYIVMTDRPWPYGRVLCWCFTKWGARRKADRWLKADHVTKLVETRS